jgi:hypothetical protein
MQPAKITEKNLPLLFNYIKIKVALQIYMYTCHKAFLPPTANCAVCCPPHGDAITAEVC